MGSIPNAPEPGNEEINPKPFLAGNRTSISPQVTTTKLYWIMDKRDNKARRGDRPHGPDPKANKRNHQKIYIYQ